MTESQGGCGVALDRIKLKGDVGEVEVLVRVDLLAEYLHHAVVREHDHVRVLFLHDDLEVVVVALIPNGVGQEADCLRGIVVGHERRVWLVFSVRELDVDLGLVVALLVNKLR